MTPASHPHDETQRLAVVRELRLADAGPDPALAAVARLAALQLACPIAAVSLVEADRQHFLARAGTDLDGSPRPHAFCAYTIHDDAIFEVTDARADERFADNPLVAGEPGIVFYAAAPVRVDGRRIGTVCVIDRAPRALQPNDHEALRQLALLTSDLLQARLREQRHRDAEQRVSEASQAGSDWLWETDAEGRLTWVSDSVEAHTGWSAAQETGRHSMALHRPPPGEWRANWDRYRAARARLAPFQDAVAERDTAHGVMLVSFSGRPRVDADGRFRGYRGAARDLTREAAERRQAQRAQALLQEAIEAIHAGVMISGPDGRILLSNATWRNGLPLDGDVGPQTWEETVRLLLRRGLYPHVPHGDEAFVRWRLGLASAEGRQHEFQVGERHMLVSDQALPDGSVIHLSLDITERKHAEIELAQQRARLAASESRLAAVLAAIPDLWIVIDVDGRHLECSDEHHPWLVRPFEDIRGKRAAEFLPAALAERIVAAIRRARDDGQVQRMEYELDALDGERRVFEARISPMHGDQALYLTRDLTELRALERDVLVMQRAMESEASPPIAVADALRPDLPLVYINPAFERLTGYARDEVLGRNSRFMQGQHTDQEGLHALRAALAHGTACTVTLLNQRRDGSSFVNELHVAPVHDGDGRLTHYIGMLQDATERTQAQERLRHSEALYRSVTIAIRDGLIVVGPDGAILTANPAAAAMLGGDVDALVGRTLDASGHHLLREDGSTLGADESPICRALRDGVSVVDAVVGMRGPDGSTRLYRLNAQPMRAQPPHPPLSCVVTFHDITAQRAAERALADAETRWKYALEGVGDAVWDMDEDANKVFYSRRWKRMLGLTDDEVGDSFDEWKRRVHPDDKAAVFAAIRRHREGLAPVYTSEYRMQHKEGHWIWVLDRGKIVERRADGSPRRVVGTHTDITRSKLVEQTLRDKQAAELASRAKSEFLSRMSHEMRTPLNAVIGFAQLLRMQDVMRPDYVDQIAQAGQHLLALINDVLDLQRVETGPLTLNLGAVDAHALVAACVTLLDALAKRGGVVQHIVPAGGVRVLADEQRLRQVLLNLGSNAIKYNRPGGHVHWHVRHDAQGRVQFVLEDDGFGMTQEQQARLFQPFERLGREASAIEGTGLGLLIARRMVQEMRGELTICSQPGKGTRVELTMPAAGAPATAQGVDLAARQLPAPSAAPPLAAAPSQRHRVLYVEDNPVNAMVFAEALRRRPQVDLRVVEDATGALELAADWRPDLLVLDANLPGMGGHELLGLLRALPGLGAVTAVMCSADAMPEDRERARAAGFNAYWTKPLDILEMLNDLDRLLERPEPG